MSLLLLKRLDVACLRVLSGSRIVLSKRTGNSDIGAVISATSDVGPNTDLEALHSELLDLSIKILYLSITRWL